MAPSYPEAGLRKGTDVAMRLSVRALVLLCGLAIGFVVITWLALESGGVAIVTTAGSEGQTRTTHVWFVEEDGVLWLEAGVPENPWYLDVLADPRLELEIEGRVKSWRAVPVDAPSRRDALRAALRAKYGWRDWWVGWLVDSSRSVPLRLEPAIAAGAPTRG